MPRPVKRCQLNTSQKTRLENHARPIVTTTRKIPQHELDRQERERLWKETKLKHEPTTQLESKENIPTFTLEKITKQCIWDTFYVITNSGSRNNEPRAKFQASINETLLNHIKEQIGEDKDLTKYINNQIERRKKHQTNKLLGPIKQP
jgi:hypothetical protein